MKSDCKSKAESEQLKQQAVRRNKKRTLRSLIKASPFCGLLRYFEKRRRYLDSSNALIYIHIGKCGGSSLWDAVRRSPPVVERFSSVSKVHCAKPPILQNSSYLIVIRNPISRAISAFNWRYKLLVEDVVKKSIFKTEYNTLYKYQSLNLLAEALYADGMLNQQVAKEFRSIVHLREDISFYLTELLNTISPTQVYAVITTEQLDQDVSEYLQVDSVPRVHANGFKTDHSKLHLSDLARCNLRKFLDADYKAIEKLLSFFPISNQKREILLS